MLENGKTLNEVSDEELAEIAGGGTYTRDGYLKTTAGYSCENFECKQCGRIGPHQHTVDGSGAYDYTVRNCHECKWHSTLRCGNPKNKR